ncbi:MAG TPA: hydrogen peroxide-dependent heme synthase [Gemmatimonadota bacterium]|nr:hydrogen peroxide-dependent heme synthase [Gemmatimonadota bacterium]
MSESKLAPLTLEGWYALHGFHRIAWPALKSLPAGERSALAEEMADLLEAWSDLGEGGWSAAYRIVGGGADLHFLHFRPDLEDLGEVERHVAWTGLADYLDPVYDFLSAVELGFYRLTADTVAGLREEGIDPAGQEGRERLEKTVEEQREKGYVQGRLYPRQPEDMPWLCFYPMDKRRAPEQNWYALDLEERNAMMVDHGGTGRLYAGRVSQVISGSIGFDDWEWGVTLFAGEPLAFKKLVTEMRFDEVSAEYADFGPFFVGRRLERDGLRRLLEEPGRAAG